MLPSQNTAIGSQWEPLALWTCFLLKKSNAELRHSSLILFSLYTTYTFLPLYLTCTVFVRSVIESLIDSSLLWVSQSSTKDLGVNIDCQFDKI